MENSNIITKVKEKAKQWLGEGFDQETIHKVKSLLENDEKELIESFYRDLEFGTGGLRGIMGVGTNRMNIYTVGMATQGLSNYVLRQFSGRKEIRAVIAYDSRNNSRLFAETTAKIFLANGIQAFLFDALRPTPELSFAIRHLSAQTGIVITASHNPKEYNGYKVYWEDGGQIISPHDKNIIEEVKKITSPDLVKWNGRYEDVKIIGQEIDEIYTDKIKEISINPDINLQQSDLKIVYTPIHGSGVKLVPMALKKFGFNNIYHIPEQDISDGNFPTVKSPNPEEPAALEMALKKAAGIKAELVMGTDPDADRVGIAIRDSNGTLKLLNGNQVASLIIYYLLNAWSSKGKLQGKEYICKTIVTTDLLNKMADKFDVKHFDVLTGFKYIADIIKKNEGKMQFIGGGEESYGYLMAEFVRDKDAVMSCAIIAELTAWAKSMGKTIFDLLTDIYIEYGFYKESLISVVKKGKEGAEEIQRMMKEYRANPPSEVMGSRLTKILDYQESISINQLSGKKDSIDLPKSNVLQLILENETKISIRPSGTEPKIKFYISVNEPLKRKEDYSKTDKILTDRIVSIQKEMNLL